MIQKIRSITAGLDIKMDLKNLPTPKTLDEAIVQALCIGPLDRVTERTYLVIRDFLAQKFTVACAKATPEESAKLKELFENIVRQDEKPNKEGTT